MQKPNHDRGEGDDRELAAIAPKVVVHQLPGVAESIELAAHLAGGDSLTGGKDRSRKGGPTQQCHPGHQPPDRGQRHDPKQRILAGIEQQAKPTPHQQRQHIASLFKHHQRKGQGTL